MTQILPTALAGLTKPLAKSDSYPPAYRSLMAVGLLGSAFKCHEDADSVHTALRLTLSDPREYLLIRALVQGQGGNAKAALATLEEMEGGADEDSGKVVLAVAKILAGDPSWQPLMENILASSADPAARAAATGVISFLMHARRT